MRTTVKICGITDSATAAFAFDQGADYVGLVLSESRRRVELTQARAITDEVPGAFVAVGKDVSEALFREMLALKVMAVQLHGRTPHDWIYRAHQADKMAIATQLQAIADVVLLDGPDPGSGVPRPWVRPLFKKPIWLAGGLTPENVNDVVRRLRPDGVDVSSGVERNGEKDYRLITNFIQEVHNGRKESS